MRSLLVKIPFRAGLGNDVILHLSHRHWSSQGLQSIGRVLFTLDSDAYAFRRFRARGNPKRQGEGGSDAVRNQIPGGLLRFGRLCQEGGRAGPSGLPVKVNCSGGLLLVSEIVFAASITERRQSRPRSFLNCKEQVPDWIWRVRNVHE